MKNNLSRKACILLLAFTVFLFSFNQQRANAFAPLLLNPYTIGALVALAGAGVAIANNPSAARAIASDFINNLTDIKLKEAFFYNPLADAGLLVTGAMSTALKGYVGDRLSTYTAGMPIDYTYQNDLGGGGQALSWTASGSTLDSTSRYYSSSGNALTTPFTYKTIKMNNDISYSPNTTTEAVDQPYLKNLFLDYQSPTYKNIGLQTVYGYQLTGFHTGTNPSYVHQPQISFLDSAGNVIYQEFINLSMLGTYVPLTSPISNVRFISLYANTDGNNLWWWNETEVFSTQQSGIQTISNTYNYNTSDVTINKTYADSAWDLSNRVITYPKKADGTTINTVEEFVGAGVTSGSLTISEPIAGATTATSVGILSSLQTMVTSIADAFVHPIGTASDIQWDKLKLSGTAFTTAFPFSLPWDVQRAWTAVFGGMTTGEPPVWVGTIANQLITIQFPQIIKDWLPFIRSITLIGFDISLVYSVRKLLGGAS